MAKDLSIPLLLDFYGEMLSPEQREAMDLCYNGDYSLAEIAEETGVTRQGARARLVRGKAALTDYENRLGLAARFTDLKKKAEELKNGIVSLGEKDGVDVSHLLELADEMIY